YALELTYDTDKPALTRDSVVVDERPDKEAPEIAAFSPGPGGHFPDDLDIVYRFTEPLDTSAISEQTFVLWGPAGEPVSVDLNWRDAFRLGLQPAELVPGAVYRLDMAEIDIADAAGNRLGDSLRSFEFSVLDQDSLGSISGTLDIRLPDLERVPVLLTFKNLGDNRKYHQTALQREFNIPLPPGKYLLSGFIDEDENDRLTPGGVQPFRTAETFAEYPDTITVRARFETAGIEMIFE
ncbi:hypothetical protein GF377_05520, partial [candidate division GN15 bacterium]|nr:hypothetical protein [candidate division GN15 bacterium]